MVDATYNLNESWMPLYLKLVIDGNGQSEIVSLFLTSLVQVLKHLTHSGPTLELLFLIKTSLNALFLLRSFLVCQCICAFFMFLDVFQREITWTG